MRKLLLPLLGVLLGISIYGIICSLPGASRRSRSRPAVPALPRELKTVSSTTEQITRSRTNAIVIAAREVSPAVVSITVTQTRVIQNPFWSPFGNDPFDWFFGDFTPPRQYRQQVKGMGSGLIIAAEGQVVTNAHVVENATEITVTLPDGKQYEAELLDVSRSHDLALLQLKGRDLPYARLGNSDEIEIGEWAIALGNPFGYLLEDARPTVTVGVISATGRSLRGGSDQGREYRNMIQTDAAINPGNSGGPLANADGEVIGINTFIFTKSGGSEGVGFAIPVNEVRDFVAAAHREARRSADEPASAKLKTAFGATVSPISRGLKQKHRLSVDSGVVVVEIAPGSIAEAAGLEPGDVILRVGSRKVSTPAEFRTEVEKQGRSLNLVILRHGSQIQMIYRY
jgi:serine protease Do